MAIICSIVISFFIIRAIIKGAIKLYKFIPAERYYGNNDYWNDAGSGSGVNYVQMPNGEVRID